MNSLKKFLTLVDIFGITFNFRYKEKERYQTALGGFIVLLFLIVAIVMAIYYFIPFVNRKNYTIVYYTMNLAETEEVSLFASESNFAVGFQCESNSAEKRSITDLLDLQIKYIYYIKEMDGTYHKDPKPVETHTCTYSDFYNKYDAQFDYLGLGDQICVGNKEYSIQGIYADKVFSYFEFSVLAKNGSKELTDEIERFLFENDCKVRFIYTDIIIDLDNYEEPIDQYLNEIFIQLNPTLFIKRNVYFMNQQFTNDNYLMFVFGDDEKPEVKPLYSRYEEYSLYKGLNRFASNVYQYEYYSKMYLRADLKTTIIKRKYQKFMEFYADASSLLIAIYEILEVIFSYVNLFYGHNDVSKKMFFFKEVENSENFNVTKKTNILNDLISITDLRKTSENIPYEKELKDSKKIKNFPPKKNQVINKNEENKMSKGLSGDRNYSRVSSYSSKGKDTEERKLNKYSGRGNYNEKYSEEEEIPDNYYNNKVNKMGRSKNNQMNLNFRYNNKQENELGDSIGTNMDDYSSDSGQRRRNKKIKVENSFNILEIIITQFFKCCMTKSMKIKQEANEMANKILFKKLDVITYSRNMILFDIINQTILGSDKKPIINFLCRPMISIKKKSKGRFDDFYNNYKEKDFNKYCDCIQELAQKSQKEDREKRLIAISNEHLKNFI